MPEPGPAGTLLKEYRPRVIRIEPSPGTVGYLLLLVVGLGLLSRLLPVVLVLVAALIIVGTVSPAVREELRVELPGQQEQAEDVEIRERDDRGEAEYERRAEGMPAEQAAAIAVEISTDRHKEEKYPRTFGLINPLAIKLITAYC